MPYLLRVLDGAREGAVFAFEDRALLGRAGDADVQIVHEGVSRHHARLRQEAADLVLVDLRSDNGTWLNGRRVDRSRLRSGDTIRIGDVRLRFEGHVAGEVSTSAQLCSKDRSVVSMRRTATLPADGGDDDPPAHYEPPANVEPVVVRASMTPPALPRPAPGLGEYLKVGRRLERPSRPRVGPEVAVDLPPPSRRASSPAPRAPASVPSQMGAQVGAQMGAQVGAELGAEEAVRARRDTVGVSQRAPSGVVTTIEPGPDASGSRYDAPWIPAAFEPRPMAAAAEPASQLIRSPSSDLTPPWEPLPSTRATQDGLPIVTPQRSGRATREYTAVPAGTAPDDDMPTIEIATRIDPTLESIRTRPTPPILRDPSALADVLRYLELQSRARTMVLAPAEQAELAQLGSRLVPRQERRRRFHRFPCGLPAEVTILRARSSATWAVQIADVGAGGVRLFGPIAVIPGDDLWLDVRLGAEPTRMRLPTHVVWFDGHAQVGLCFAGPARAAVA